MATRKPATPAPKKAATKGAKPEGESKRRTAATSGQGAPLQIPKSLGACADLYFTLKEQRLAKEKEAAEIQKQESFVKEHLINSIPKSEATGVAGKLARVSVVVKPEPRVEDEEKFRAYVSKNKRWDLMTKAINRAAIKEMWEAKKTVPGIGSFEVVTLSCNKVS